MKTRKLIFVMILAIVMLITSTSSVHAASPSINMSPDKTNLAEGYEVTITVSITADSNPIYGGDGIIDYSTDVFEKITSTEDGISTSVVGLNGWVATYNDANNKFLLTSIQPIRSSSLEVMQIKLKVKSGAKLGTSIVKLINSEVSGYETGSLVNLSDTSVSFNITTSGSGSEGNVTPIIPSLNTNTNPSTNTNTNKNTNIITNTGAANGTVPQTGISDYAVPVIFGALVISVISYVAYIRYKDV